MRFNTPKTIWNAEYLFKRKLNEFIFFVTNRCNLECQGCFYRQELNRENNELTLEEIEKILDSIGPVNKVFLSGGEPFLRKDFAGVVDLIIQKCHPFYISLPTNGYATEMILHGVQTILTAHSHLRLAITLSLDGLEKTHDALKGCHGLFKRVLSTAAALSELKKEHKFFMLLNTVVSNLNYHEIAPLCSFVKNNGNFDYHGFAPMRGNVRNKSMKPPTGNEWMRLQNSIRAYQIYYSRKRASFISSLLYQLGKISYDNVIANALDNYRWPFPCRAGVFSLVLEPDGRVRLCELTEPVGNVRDFGYSVKTLMCSLTARKMAGFINSRICSKQCTHGCFLEPSFLADPLNVIKGLAVR